MRLLLALTLVLSLAACQPDADDAAPAETPTGAETPPTSSAVTVRDPFVTAAPEGGTGGVFLTLVGGAEADTLVGARSSAAARVEVHETYDGGDGLRGMREVEGGLAVPTGSTVELRPGSYHIMLIGLTRTLAEGDTLDLDLDMARAGAVPVRVPVRSLRDLPAPE